MVITPTLTINSFSSPALAVALKKIRYVHVAQLELTVKTYLNVPTYFRFLKLA